MITETTIIFALFAFLILGVVALIVGGWTRIKLNKESVEMTASAEQKDETSP